MLSEESDYSHWLIECYKIAAKSNDPSTHNGAILINEKASSMKILAQDFNKFPAHVEETEVRWERPLKYAYVEHAERNVIFQAARHGIMTSGLTMVCPWAACHDCARAIIQSGITTLVRHKPATEHHGTWGDSIAIADQMMWEAGVKVIEVSSVPGWKLLRDGKLTDTGDL